MINSIKQYCDKLVREFQDIPQERKAILDKISQYIIQKRNDNKPINLVYICTHNSRRSHFGQVWSHVAASYYGIQNVNTYSGGTEVTTFNINAINALKRVGFVIKPINSEENTTYHVFHDDKESPSVCFSKVYNDIKNPPSKFASIMTCSDAEENCPFLSGVELRVGTTYDDPKVFDNTPQQDSKYDERCKQIALETLYIFSRVK
ncbi:MAG: protein-tyrosine-phosphatase [Bacteroidia bacterium]|nr:protein-tyrosine-phosphatase [Bacteroidia bacterium]